MGDGEQVSAKPAAKGAKQEPTAPGRTFPVVGIGASAGGLEACQALLKVLPANLGMAYVFVPHLDPSRESALREILARASSMPVIEVEEATTMTPNHVYVIPHNCEMKVQEGILHLFEREHPRPVNTTIDTFLRSLAADQGGNAIGIILSGTASDGTIGLTAIKAEGGITFAQDSSAKYDGMPASAINAGAVDMVLPPEGIAGELARIARHPYVSGSSDSVIAYTKEAQMGQLFAILRRATRVDFSEYKPPTISRRVARRMALHKIEALPDYIALLWRDPSEVHALYKDLLINVTSFFRAPEAFDALRKIVYPELLKSHAVSASAIRIWVPGCSTGEESYSIAISLTEFLEEQRIEIPLQVFGTDLSEVAVQRARLGLYKETIEADISPVRLRRYFHRVDSGYQISKTIRDMCIFSIQNVFADPPFSRIDLLSCRNVMIYLSQTLQKRVIPVFHYALAPNGFLMIGNAEGLLGSGPELFEMADKKQKIYRKKSIPTPMTFGFAVRNTAEPFPNGQAQQAEAKPPEPAHVSMDLQREADRLLLARYAPPSVVVNEELEIVQTRGDTGPYLQLPPGKVSLNLLKMVRSGLLFDLQNALEEARKSGVDAVSSGLQVEREGIPTMTSLRVTPFRSPAQNQTSYLVIFEPPESGSLSTSGGPILSPLGEDERTVKDKQLAQLRQELAATREYLQAINEALESTNQDLQSANNEIQSGNEELQSTNEELQTSKEELESANEELHTVNEEMQYRNDLLMQLNNDLTKLLNTVNVPMVMVGPDLSVRRFTPLASTVLGLMATDVGRPLTRLRLKLQAENLEQMMLGVMSNMRPSEHRVLNDEGQSCELRITPYRTADNRIDGVVLSVSSFEGLEDAKHPRPGKKTGPSKKAAKAGSRNKKSKKSK